jgi:hypothetical protein
MYEIIKGILTKYKVIIITFTIGFGLGVTCLWFDKSNSDNNYKRTAQQLADSLKQSESRITLLSNELSQTTIAIKNHSITIGLTINTSDKLGSNLNIITTGINQLDSIVQAIREGNER